MNKLNLAKQELNNGKLPYDWKYFGKHFEYLNRGEFKNVSLLLQNQQCTIITRSKKNPVTFNEEVEAKLKIVGEYVGRLEESLGRRFMDKIDL